MHHFILLLVCVNGVQQMVYIITRREEDLQLHLLLTVKTKSRKMIPQTILILDLETVSEDKRNYYLRMELRRTSQKWSHVPVNKTCEDHSSDQNQFPIQVYWYIQFK